MNYERELEFACRLAIAAGENARLIRASGISAETKPDMSPVTVADRENELIVRGAIEREFPDDGILGEEGSSRSGSSRRRWIIEEAGGEFFALDGSRRIDRGTALACAPGVSRAGCEAFGIVPG